MIHPVKRKVEGTFVALLFHKQEERGMQLIEFETRCVKQGEIHEIVTTTHFDAIAGDRIDRVGFLGFAEIQCGGVIGKGDPVMIQNQVIGRVLGFDDCHFPNHYNILISTVETCTAHDLKLEVESTLTFGEG
ncbi:hypothetical protein J2Z69_001279 [Paenibacillus shirakamiensis]|uniref:DUF6917 domain-containing protein n=1 Tax=Paenibacillus shirakamiensis TaxID=1265935 RepID=A0ABS4JGU1_9BACL|nr:hypothetical protein [Paenibacillus shirakamiensis]MBP2000260.1 hypothetical protein [Paenibacillus shirakamiensis]